MGAPLDIRGRTALLAPERVSDRWGLAVHDLRFSSDRLALPGPLPVVRIAQTLPPPTSIARRGRPAATPRSGRSAEGGTGPGAWLAADGPLDPTAVLVRLIAVDRQATGYLVDLSPPATATTGRCWWVPARNCWPVPVTRYCQLFAGSAPRCADPDADARRARRWPHRPRIATSTDSGRDHVLNMQLFVRVMARRCAYCNDDSEIFNAAGKSRCIN